MPVVNKSLLVPYTAEQMYSLINAVELYPEFLPWCKGTEIHTRSDTELKATLHLAKGPMTHSITTVNAMLPNEKISMQYIAGPFRNCVGAWQFVPSQDAKQCQVIFTMDYAFVNKFMAIAIEPVFNPIANTLIDCFYKRAEQIYAN
jgi:ribosome-associated toxin RatA of RatAB toxin-antitoxin module